MKIAFDASDLCADDAGGTTRFTWELATRLPSMAPEHSWEFFAPCAPPASLSSETWHSSPWLSLDLFRKRPDVLFMPIQQLPIIRPHSMKTVAVIHDLAFHVYPQESAYKDWLFLHISTAQVAYEADHIIAISRATADDIARFYGRTENVHVIHHGVDHQRFRLPDAEAQLTGWRTLHAAYPQLNAPYMLYVGHIQPRTNLIRAVEAFENIAREEPDYQFVISSDGGRLQKPIIERIQSSRYLSRIRMIGRAADELLPALYWHADVCILPSLYEGSGIRIMEAMACGTPVVTSHGSCLPDLAGGAAVLIDPLSVDSMTHGLRTARAEAQELVHRGIQRASQLTPEATAQAIMRVITS